MVWVCTTTPLHLHHETKPIGPGPLQRARVRRNEADGWTFSRSQSKRGLSEAYRVRDDATPISTLRGGGGGGGMIGVIGNNAASQSWWRIGEGGLEGYDWLGTGRGDGSGRWERSGEGR
jgi:hypothetical protein